MGGVCLAYQVVEVDHSYGVVLLVDYGEYEDFAVAVFHDLEGLGGEDVGGDAEGIAGHYAAYGLMEDVVDGAGGTVGFALEYAAEVAVCEDAAELALLIYDGDGAVLFGGNGGDGFAEGGGFYDDWVGAGFHEIAHALELAAEGAVGVAEGEVAGLKTALFEENNGEGITHGEGGGGGCSWGEVEGADFAVDLDVENDVGFEGEAAFEVAGHGDEEVFVALKEGDAGDDFFGGAAVGEGEDDVVGLDHAKVAMEGFTRVNVEGGGAGAGHGGCDFAGDEAVFAHAGEDHAAAAVEDGGDGGVEAVADAAGHGLKGADFLLDDFLAALGQVMGGIGGHDWGFTVKGDCDSRTRRTANGERRTRRI